MELTPKKPKSAKRGRPARLSREQVLQAALKLLEKGPAEVTLNGVARALKVSPMSLYTHVENRDDLLLGVSELVLNKLQLKLNADCWESNVRLWTDQVQAHLSRYPQIVKLLGESRQVPVGWLLLQAQLVTVLDQAGLRGSDLSSTCNLLGQALIFDCLLNVEQEKSREDLVGPALHELSDRDRRCIEMLLHTTPPAGYSMLEFVREQLLERARAILLHRT